MSANTFSSDLVNMAYRLLKHDAYYYYGKMVFFVYANIAIYTESDLFQKRQDALATVLDEHLRFRLAWH